MGVEKPKHTWLGWDEIARNLSVCALTAQRWEIRHGLPVVRTPSGRVVLSRSLYDAWLLARRAVQLEDKARRDAARQAQKEASADQSGRPPPRTRE